MRSTLFAALMIFLFGAAVGWSLSSGLPDRSGCSRAPSHDAAILIRTDTLIIRDTVTIDRPVFRDRRIIDTLLVTRLVTDTVYLADADTFELVTKPHRFDLPIEQRHYSDSTFDAWVSGYCPSLDSIHVYPTTRIVTAQTLKTQSVKRWGIGIQAGYGAYIDNSAVRLAPYIGVGLSYNIIRF